MGVLDFIKKAFKPKEVEVYNPQREHIDRTHDAYLRQLSYYQKKNELPKLKAEIRRLEKENYGNNLHTKDENNILKVPNHFKESSVYQDIDSGTIDRAGNINPRQLSTQRRPPFQQPHRQPVTRPPQPQQSQRQPPRKQLSYSRQMTFQRRIARALAARRQSQQQTQRFQRRPSAPDYGNDGNLLHARNHFTTSQPYQENNILNPQQQDILKTPHTFSNKGDPYSMIKSSPQKSKFKKTSHGWF